MIPTARLVGGRRGVDTAVVGWHMQNSMRIKVGVELALVPFSCL